jgi:hypothetical protein
MAYKVKGRKWEKEGTFKIRKQAIKEAKKLREKGYQVKIVKKIKLK